MDEDQTRKPCVAWVVCVNGGLQGTDFRLVPGKNVIGTAADCEVVLTDQYLSSRHAVIRYDEGRFTLVDLDSTNGTLFKLTSSSIPAFARSSFHAVNTDSRTNTKS